MGACNQLWINAWPRTSIMPRVTYSAWLMDGSTGPLSDSMADVGSCYGPAGPDLRDGQFHHVAITVARNNSTGGKLYVDGQAVLTFDPTGEPGDLTAAAPLRIGNHATEALSSFLKGTIDEVSIYNRAVSALEIQSIYVAGSAGKCTVPGTNDCVPSPASLVAWWPGEGDADDIAGTNHGVLLNGVAFTNGVVGQGLFLDGVDDRVVVPDAPSLNFGPGADFSIEAWIKPDAAVTDGGVQSIVDKRLAPDIYHAQGYVFCRVDGRLTGRLSDSMTDVVHVMGRQARTCGMGSSTTSQ